VYALAVYQGKLIAGGFFTSAGGVPARNIAAWDGISWSALGDGVDLRVNALAVYDGKLIVGGGATSFYFNQDFLASWDGQSWSSLGSGTNGVIYALTVYDHGLVVGGNFTTAGGKPSPYLALWTKQEIREVAVDVRPGSCPNPINVNPHAEAGQGVVPVAILGTAELDVREIEPESVMLEGVHARRWNYGDVAAPAGGQTGDCSCSTEGPDGYEDLELLFPRSELTCAMGAVSGGLGPPGRSAHETYTVQLEGFLDDGSAIEGSDCVTLVGGREALLSPQQSVSDLQVRSLSGSAGPSVRINFTLTGASHVRLGVYNVLGQEVASLIDDIRGPGPQSVIWNGDRVASGIYYYRVQADRDMETKKLLLLK
jgi:hypothetical protein